MTDRQLPIQPTQHIDPTTIVTLIPGVDAVCEGGLNHNCEFPWCTCFARPDNEEAA